MKLLGCVTCRIQQEEGWPVTSQRWKRSERDDEDLLPSSGHEIQPSLPSAAACSLLWVNGAICRTTTSMIPEKHIMAAHTTSIRVQEFKYPIIRQVWAPVLILVVQLLFVSTHVMINIDRWPQRSNDLKVTWLRGLKDSHRLQDTSASGDKQKLWLVD